jgi:hypothetical protein
MDLFEHLFEKTPDSGDKDTASNRFMDEVNETRANGGSDKKAVPPSNTLTKNVESALQIIGGLPSGSYPLDGYVFKGAMYLASDEIKSNANFFLKGVDAIDKNGSRIEMARKGEVNVDINQDVAGGLISVKSINIGSTGFDVVTDGDVSQLRNVKGLSINLSAAGEDMNIAVKELTLSKDGQGNPVLTASVENPLPWATRLVLGLSDTIDVPVSLGADGKSPTMKTSQVLSTVADLTPNFPLPLGFVTPANMVRAAAYAAEFVEDHPSVANTAVKAAMSTTPVGLAYNLLFD